MNKYLYFRTESGWLKVPNKSVVDPIISCVQHINFEEFNYHVEFGDSELYKYSFQTDEDSVKNLFYEMFVGNLGWVQKRNEDYLREREEFYKEFEEKYGDKYEN